jgi:hypothetical protein
MDPDSNWDANKGVESGQYRKKKTDFLVLVGG